MTLSASKLEGALIRLEKTEPLQKAKAPLHSMIKL
jgi:hypothetical protein